MGLCRDTFVLDERAIVWTCRSAFGFALGFVGDGVDGLGPDMSDEPTNTSDDERMGAEAGTGRDAGRGDPSVNVARFLTDALRASRPPTAAPSLIQP
jgi:hypothetical protein